MLTLAPSPSLLSPSHPLACWAPRSLTLALPHAPALALSARPGYRNTHAINGILGALCVHLWPPFNVDTSSTRSGPHDTASERERQCSLSQCSIPISTLMTLQVPSAAPPHTTCGTPVALCGAWRLAGHCAFARQRRTDCPSTHGCFTSALCPSHFGGLVWCGMYHRRELLGGAIWRRWCRWMTTN